MTSSLSRFVAPAFITMIITTSPFLCLKSKKAGEHAPALNFFFTLLI
jgi:hypothetical protein